MKKVFRFLTAGCAGALRSLAAVAMAVGVVTGCATTAQDPHPVDVTPSGVQAVVVGLNRVDPVIYYGWSGALADCEVDADIFSFMAEAHGLKAAVLKTKRATRDAVFGAIRMAAAGLGTNDLLFVAHSSHGGQVEDTSGDEADGMDETICLFDANVPDDQVFDLVCSLPPCRIFLISDSCHSEGNFKAPPFVLAQERQKGEKKWAGSILQFAGCREALTSQSTGSGGRWTTALVDAYSTNQTYLQWFEGALGKMPADQVPMMVEYGVSFADMEVFK